MQRDCLETVSPLLEELAEGVTGRLATGRLETGLRRKGSAACLFVASVMEWIVFCCLENALRDTLFLP